MKSKSALIVGCGDLGARTGALLCQRGWQVAGVRRDPGRLPAGFAGFQADYTLPGSLDFSAELRPSFVLATFTPRDRSPAGYTAGFTAAATNLLEGLDTHRPEHIIMVSSTRVFAECQGGWVDEASALTSRDQRALAIIRAEELLLGTGLAASVVRFGGIYGASGGRLLSRVRRGELCPEQPLRYSNRIHRDDCAGFLAHLLVSAQGGAALAPVYLGVDDLPAPQFEVESWLARQLGIPPQSRVAARPAQSGHKRCRNSALRASGYRLLYPDYRAGYREILAR